MSESKSISARGAGAVAIGAAGEAACTAAIGEATLLDMDDPIMPSSSAFALRSFLVNAGIRSSTPAVVRGGGGLGAKRVVKSLKTPLLPPPPPPARPR